MTTSPLTMGTTESAADWVPADACTLPTVQQPMRVAEFDDLFATSLREIQRADPSGTRARLVLGGDQSLPARVQRLADAETSCCSFFTFTVTPLDANAAQTRDETVVALDIEVPSSRADVLDALVYGAAAARQVAS